MRAAARATAAIACALAAGGARAHHGSPVSEIGLAGRTDILYFEDFETNSSGGTCTDDPKLVMLGRRALKVMYKQGEHGVDGKPKNYPQFRQKLDCIYVRRYIMFEPDFDFAAGGKVDGSICFAPGKRWLAGFGGKPSHGNDGFSCRLCWASRGRIIMYTYHAEMRGRYGADFGGSRRFTPGAWQCIELMIKINTIDQGAAKGNNDGVVRLWVDGQQVDEQTGIRFRDLPEMGLDNWSYGFYFGGTWTCPKDQYIYMDNVVVATNYIGPAVLRRPTAEPTSIVYRPKETPDPLTPFVEKLGPVRQKAAEAAFAEAMELCTGLLVESVGSEGFDALRAYGEGLAAGAELKRSVIEHAAVSRPTVYIEFSGHPARAQIISADAAGVRCEVSGNVMSLRWGLIAPLRFYGIASKVIPDTPRHHLHLARYCAAMRLRKEAAEELGAVASDPGLAEDIESVRVLLK